MDSSRFKQLVKDKFDARTEYDKDNKRHPKLAVELVQRAELRRGWSVLDLACGTGFVTFLAADIVGATGAVAGIDLSPVMIQQVKLNMHKARGSVRLLFAQKKMKTLTLGCRPSISCNQEAFLTSLLRSWIWRNAVFPMSSLMQYFALKPCSMLT